MLVCSAGTERPRCGSFRLCLALVVPGAEQLQIPDVVFITGDDVVDVFTWFNAPCLVIHGGFALPASPRDDGPSPGRPVVRETGTPVR